MLYVSCPRCGIPSRSSINALGEGHLTPQCQVKNSKPRKLYAQFSKYFFCFCAVSWRCVRDVSAPQPSGLVSHFDFSFTFAGNLCTASIGTRCLHYRSRTLPSLRHNLLFFALPCIYCAFHSNSSQQTLSCTCLQLTLAGSLAPPSPN